LPSSTTTLMSDIVSFLPVFRRSSHGPTGLQSVLFLLNEPADLPRPPPLRELAVADQPPQERGDAARNRTLLLDAARRLIAERGPDAVTTDDIAAAAGV